MSNTIARGGRLIVSKLQSVSMCGDGCCFLIGETESCRCSGRTGRVQVEAVGGSRSPGSNTIVVMADGEELEVVGSASSGLFCCLTSLSGGPGVVVMLVLLRLTAGVSASVTKCESDERFCGEKALTTKSMYRVVVPWCSGS